MRVTNVAKVAQVADVSEKNNFYFQYPVHTHSVIARIASVLMKMITGESPHPEIFQTVRTAFEFLKSVSQESISDFETLTVLRILHQLGYIARDSVTETFLQNPTEWSIELLKKITESRTVLIGLINKGLAESQL